MAALWIVDRSPRRRAAVARLAAAPQSAVKGAPGDPRFDAAAAPDVVLLALDGDWERELQFAHASQRAGRARWILLGAPDQEAAARRLFDTRSVEFLTYPPDAETLRSHIDAAGLDGTAPLSERARRNAVAARFALWFEDLDLPDVLRALDPRLADVPLLIRGEAGTGRGCVARYVHLFGGTGRGALAHVPCLPDTRPSDVARGIALALRGQPAPPALCIWLDGLEALPLATQRELESWLEVGLPGPAAGTPLLRWVATLREDAAVAVDPPLRRALAGLTLRLPPLRERPHAIRRIANETARIWCARRQERQRRFGEDALAVMDEYPWPGNLRELEALVVQSLASTSSDPLRADDLQLEGRAFAPLDAGEVGALIEEGVTDAPASATSSDVEIDALLEGIAPRENGPRPAASSPAPEPAREAAPEPSDEAPLVRLAAALAGDARSPLATLRCFASLLPERFDDRAFRDRFAESLGHDAAGADALAQRLAALPNLAEPQRDKVDVSGLLEELLEERRQRIRAQRLLVLKELDTSRPHALADREQLRFALDVLLGKALEWVPTHGDVYLASRHHAAGGRGGATVRVLIRFHDPGDDAGGPRGGSVDGSLELLVAEVVVRAQGGSLGLTSTDGDETVILIDLPAP